MKLIKGYRDLLKAVGLKEDENGRLISSLGDDTPVAVTLRGTKKSKFVVLPTKEVIRAEEDPEVLKFNPMAEHIMAAAPSEMMEMLVTAASRQLVYTGIQAARILLELIMTPSRHETLEQGAFQLIQKTPQLKNDTQMKNTREFFHKVLEKQTGIQGRKAVGRLKLDRNVELNGNTYMRACRFVPTCMREMEKDAPYGIKMPKYALETIRAVFDGVFGQMGTHVVGVANDNDAPYFNAFVKAYATAVDHLNEVIRLTHADKSELDIRIPLDWTKEVGKFKEYYLKEARIQYPGNTGPINEDEVENNVEDDEPPFTVEAQTTTVTPNVEPQTTSEPEQVETQPSQKETKMEDRVVITNPGYDQIIDSDGVPVTRYRSPYARLGGNNTTSSSQESTSQSQQVNAEPTEKVASKLNIQTQQQVQHEQRQQANLVHLHDANNRPLFTMDGKPLKVKGKDVPQRPVVQRTNGNQLLWDEDGMPLLMEVTGTQGMPNGHVHPGMHVNGNMDPVTAWRMQQQQQRMQMGYPGQPQQYPGQVPQYPGQPQQQQAYPGYPGQAPQYPGQPIQQWNQPQMPQSTLPPNYNPHG